MSDTPETDHLENGLGTAAEMSHPTLWAFARTLERERNDLREIFPMILVSLKSGACAATCSVDFLRKIPKEVRLVRERLEHERDEARGQRDASREELADWRILNGWGGTPEIVNDFIKGQQTRIHHAQNIEEELTAAREESEKWEQLAHDKLSEVCRQIEKTRAVTEQRDRLADALKEIQWSNNPVWQSDRIKQALQSLNQTNE